jgi:hypothetical protein
LHGNGVLLEEQVSNQYEILFNLNIGLKLFLNLKALEDRLLWNMWEQKSLKFNQQLII